MTMIKIHSKPLNKTIEIDRLIGKYKGSNPGPTLIFTGGIHGNEPAGVFALKDVLADLNKRNPDFNGTIYAISGNLSALEKGIRFNQVDLNRIWTHEKIAGLEDEKVISFNDELVQQREIYDVIQDILEKEEGPFYFIDLHTTSGETVPFITVNDSLLNRKFTKRFPVPLILGIEEFLEGPMLSYINELGYVAFGFESGQHDSVKAIDYAIAFIYLTMVYTGNISAADANYMKYFHLLNQEMSFPDRFYEIFHRHEIKNGERFKMYDGFVNFQHVKKGELLANSDGEDIHAGDSGFIFMPLYQGKGDDGYFLIRKTAPFFLKLSSFVRQLSIDRMLVALPGVNWKDDKREELVVDLKVARFFTRQFFHLMGYRSKQKDATHLRVKNREAVAREWEYKDAPWN